MNFDRLKDLLGNEGGGVAPRIGKYEVEREIGRGGMAVVYEAWDPDLDRPVAIKVLNQSNLDRLRQEASAAARLRHPNIVAVHEVGPNFIVMDLVRGRTLAEAMPALPLEERVRVLESVARAVAFAHSQGVIHRDLKPQNIVIDVEGRVVLMDFGLAKLFKDTDALTVDGSVMGTPEYMAPEQVRGRGVGPPADIWALGVLLCELVTDRHPFRGGTALEVYDQIARRDPPPLPGPLGAVAQKALEKDPTRRYPRATDLADDLAHFLRGEPVRASRLPRRLRRLAVPAAVAVLLAAAGGAGYFKWQSALTSARQVPGEASVTRWRGREDAESRALRANPDSVEHLLARGEVRAQLAQIEWEYGRDPFPTLAAAAQDVARARAIEPGSRRANFVRGKIHSQAVACKAKSGIDPLPDAEAAEAALGATIEMPGAKALRANVRLHRALWRAKSGVDMRDDLAAAEADLTPAVNADLLMRRGRVRGYLGHFEEAERDFIESLRLSPNNYWTWTLRGIGRQRAGDHVAAEAHFSESIRLWPEFAEAWEHRGNLRLERGRRDEALADFRQAAALNPSLASQIQNRLQEGRASAARAAGSD